MLFWRRPGGGGSRFCDAAWREKFLCGLRKVLNNSSSISGDLEACRTLLVPSVRDALSFFLH